MKKKINCLVMLIPQFNYELYDYLLRDTNALTRCFLYALLFPWFI